MAINFAAASTAGLHNPGTEIIKVVTGENSIGYEEMLAYIRSGDVPSLFVTFPHGQEGELYQFAGYSESDKKIRFMNDKAIIVFEQGMPTFYKEVLSPGSLLDGTTVTITPKEVFDAVTSGRPVAIRHSDDTFGLLTFTCFNIANAMVVSNSIVNVGGAWILYVLFGDATTGVEWSTSSARLSTS